MAQPDGTIIIDTRIDTEDVDSDLGKLKNKLQKSADDSVKSGNKVAQSLGKGIKIAAKVGITAVTTAATAITALVTKSVKSFAEYEQLAGGVEKIFDEMDSSEIFNDAASAYKTLNMSANEYLTAINNVGATFAATMGDKKGYDTAKKGLQAISDYATGTGGNIEELSEKYKLITKSTSSYQGVVDQFSALLPQTSADFLKQAQAAGLLSKKYEKLTDVPVAEYQQAVTAMLEKGVDALGLTGNTAAEAASTLSGSLGMMSAAWDNLVTGLANEGADIGLLVENLTESAGAFLKNLTPLISTALAGIGTAVQGLVPVLASELPSIIRDALPSLLSAVTTLIESLVEALPDIMSAINEVIPLLINAIMTSQTELTDAAFLIILTLADGLTQSLPTLIPSIVDVALQIVQTLIDNIPLMINAAAQLIVGLADGILLALPGLMEQIPQIITGIVNILTSSVEPILMAGVALLTALINAIPLVIPPLVGAIPGIINAIINVLLDNIPLLIDSALLLYMAIVDAIPLLIGELVPQIPAITGTIINALIAAGPGIMKAAAEALMHIILAIPQINESLATNMLQMGKNIVEGIWRGISNGYSWIKNKISGWVGNVVDFMKNLFGIHSPSTLMRDEIGKFLASGVAVGFEVQMPKELNGMEKALGTIATIQPRIPYAASGMMVPAIADMYGYSFRQRSEAGGDSVSTVTNVDFTAVIAELRQLREDISNMRLYLNGRQLVGGIINDVDRELGYKRIAAQRGGS